MEVQYYYSKMPPTLEPHTFCCWYNDREMACNTYVASIA